MFDDFRRQYLDMILQTYLTELRDVMASQGELNSKVHRKLDISSAWFLFTNCYAQA